MRLFYWCEYDTDGGWGLYSTTTPDAPKHYLNLLGPFETHAESKRELLRALQHCADVINGVLSEVREYENET